MKFDDYYEMSKQCLDSFNEETSMQYLWKDRENSRLLWKLCRDKYDKAIMMSYYFGDEEDDSKLSEYQVAFMDKCQEVVTSYMKSAPTWIDVILK